MVFESPIIRHLQSFLHDTVSKKKGWGRERRRREGGGEGEGEREGKGEGEGEGEGEGNGERGVPVLIGISG